MSISMRSLSLSTHRKNFTTLIELGLRPSRSMFPGSQSSKRLTRFPFMYTKALFRIMQSLNIFNVLRILLTSLSSFSKLHSHSLSFLALPSSIQFPFLSSQPSRSLLTFLLVLNARSLPFTWTFRVLWCVIKVRTRYGVAWAGTWARYWERYYMRKLDMGRYGRRYFNNTSFSAVKDLQTREATEQLTKELPKEAFNESLRHQRLCEMESWLESVTPVGEHPFEWEGKYDTWVGFDDSDFNMHMSNSSYPKILDFARTKASLELFPQFLRVGGHVALSSTHFHFINELPLFSKYQIRLSIGAWDEKWCYIVCRFVTQTKTKEKRNSNNGTLNPPRILVNGLPPPLNENLNGLKLHTIAVSRICFKHGRITVPPAIVFATNGMSMYPWEVAATATLKSSRVRLAESTVEASASLSPFAAQEFSHTNPPPSWTNHARQLIAKTHGGDEAKLREFYRGGWRFVDTLTQVGTSATEMDMKTPPMANDVLENPEPLSRDFSIWNLKTDGGSEAHAEFSSDVDYGTSSNSSANSSDSESDEVSSPSTSPSTTPPTSPSTTPLTSTSVSFSSLQWWDLAMGAGTSTVETQLKARLEDCRKLVGGMEGVRELCQ